jgi:hypothetical protein
MDKTVTLIEAKAFPLNDWTIKLQPFLRELEQMPRAPRRGSDVYAGYIRGCGLKFGNLRELCLADPVFIRAMDLATSDSPNGKKRTIVDAYNLMNLFPIMKMNMAPESAGHIVEFGSLRGGSAIFLAYAARHLLPNSYVISFDTFAGFPATDSAIDVYGKGAFEKVDLDELRRFVSDIPLPNLTFIEGTYADTVPDALAEIGSVSLVHIDCDVRSSVAFACEQSKPYMTSGAHMVFGDPLVVSA